MAFAARANASKAMQKRKSVSQEKVSGDKDDDDDFPDASAIFEYVRPLKDPSRYDGFRRKYLLFTNELDTFVNGDRFGLLDARFGGIFVSGALSEGRATGRDSLSAKLFPLVMHPLWRMSRDG